MRPDITGRLIEERRRDLSATGEYPVEKLAAIVREVGFACDCCTRCCTAEYNGHVFLLSSDASRIREIAPDALVPAPGYEFCDQEGRFYVSGYSLRTGPDGRCVFLEGSRCRIYPDRPEICRVYPYMLHREPDEHGVTDWRQISGLDEHGTYHNPISREESLRIAEMTKTYEVNFISQEIAFLGFVRDLFDRNNLRHVRRVYDLRMRDFHRGESLEVHVWNGVGLDRHIIRKEQDLA